MEGAAQVSTGLATGAGALSTGNPRECALCPRGRGGPCVQAPGIARQGGHPHTSIFSLTSASNNLLQRRRGQPICDHQVLGVPRGAHPAERPKALGEYVPAKADSSSPGGGVGWGVLAFGLAAAPGGGIGMVQGQGGRRCSRTDGVRALHKVRAPLS